MKWEPREKNENVDRDLKFQTLDWYSDDFENDSTGFLEYKIFVFGVDQENNPVSLCINNFYPFFFIEVPSIWDSTCVYSVREAFNTIKFKVKIKTNINKHKITNVELNNFLSNINLLNTKINKIPCKK